jgi:excisionase family DNA binding protein
MTTNRPNDPTQRGSGPASHPLTPSQAADYLGLDVKTITRWARQGYLPAHPLGEGKRRFWRFLEAELSEWLSAKTNRRDVA